MSQQPFSPSALRGAVDLSALSGAGRPGAPRRPAPAAGQQAPSSGGGRGNGLVVEATDSTFNQLVSGTVSVPAVLVLWAEQVPESADHVTLLGRLAQEYQGRFQVAAVELQSNPGVMQAVTPVLQQAFGQITSLPVVIGLLAGQPVPFYLGPQPEEQVRQVLDQFLEAAVANGVTGRVDVAAAGAAEGEGEPQLPESHQRALEALEKGDLEGATAAYEQALKDNPGDDEARRGLARVRLIGRTRSLDLVAVRAAAADNPRDPQAQIDAADVDLAGGHVEDAFARLVDTVRVTAGDDRNRVREHLLELFEVVGSHDPRVVKARQALASALF
jgi:putative thioredoxin